MALISRIFSKKEKRADPSLMSTSKESRQVLFNLNKNEVRIVIFRECDRRGRKLLFDSTLVEKVPLDLSISSSNLQKTSTDMFVEVSKNSAYKYKKPHADTTSLGETILGCVAMVSKGPTVKVHTIKEPACLMFSKVIQAPRSRTRSHNGSNENKLDNSQGSSMGDVQSIESFGSKQSLVDECGFNVTPDCLSTSCCSGCPLHPCHSQPNSNSSLKSDSSLSSLRRRWVRSVATSLNLNETSHLVTPLGKRTKLGVALIIPLATSNAQEMEQLLLERLPIVNNILTRVQHSTEQAYCVRDVFVQSMVQASNLARQSVWELMGGPTLDTPMWLSLSSARTDTASMDCLASILVSDLTHLLATLDTKHTNFFLSTLLTAVLTQHLGWVPTVLAPTHTDNMLEELSRNHPYNPLWAQMSDLQGALDYPPKTAKTVVVGKSQALVQQLLSVLSYFIRCGHVTAIDPEPEVMGDEEGLMEHLMEHGSLTDKEGIREFSKAGSDIDANSTTTLTKNLSLLSMKTFSLTDCCEAKTNSLESGFESSNDFPGENYNDENVIMRAQQIDNCHNVKSYAYITETSFSENTMTNLKFEIDSCSLNTSNSCSVIKVIDSCYSNIGKVENEMQRNSAQMCTKFGSNLLSSDYKNKNRNFISKNNVFQNDGSEVKVNDEKVVFMLGENEELVNLKTKDKSDKLLNEAAKNDKLEQPVIQVNDDVSVMTPNCGERSETDFVTGDVNKRVVIVRSNPIQLGGSSNLRALHTNYLHRCLSAPEEVVSYTAWLKKKRSQHVPQLVKRWSSDSTIWQTETKLDTREVIKTSHSNYLPDCVFMTTNRTCDKDSDRQLLFDKVSTDVPEIIVDDTGQTPVSPEGLNSFIELPFQRSVEGRRAERLVGVASSLLGGVRDTYFPELTLQGLTRPPRSLHDSAQPDDVGILANTDTWEVVLVSNQARGSAVGVGMSQLVANMLETTGHLYNLTGSHHLCLAHIEAKLLELCVRSQALAELLLNSHFLDIATLTSELDLDANDVPLLLSIASTHSPQVTHKYGLSFQ